MCGLRTEETPLFSTESLIPWEKHLNQTLSKLVFVPYSCVTEVPDHFCFIQWSFTLMNDPFVLFFFGDESSTNFVIFSSWGTFFLQHFFFNYLFSKRYLLFQDISLLMKHCLPRLPPLVPFTLKSFPLHCLVGTCLFCQISD